MNTKSFKRFIALALVVAIACMNTRRAEAMLAPVDAPGIMSLRRTQDMATVQTFLEQKQVSEKLAGYGLTSEEVNSRLQALTDTELHQISTRIDQQNPGRDGGGFIVTVLLIGILVLLFVYLLKRV